MSIAKTGMRSQRTRMAVAAMAVVSLVFSTSAALTAHFTFDDAGNGGLNLLKPLVGSDAVVRGSPARNEPAVDINGLGNLTPTNGEGRTDGAGAIAIPKGQFLAVPHGLAQTTGAHWFIGMRICFPELEFHAPVSLSGDNTEDAFIFGEQNANRLGGSSAWGGYSSKGLSAGTWHSVVLACDGTKTSLYIDGAFQRSTTDKAARSQGTDLTGLGVFNISGDNDGEDGLVFVDDLLIGSSGVVVVAPEAPAAKTWTGARQTSGLADTDDYTVVHESNCTDCGFHPIRLSLRAPETQVWSDGTTADKIYYLTIREALLFPELRVHYDFDDAGNSGANLLKAAVGDDAIVREGSNPATDVEGIGSLYAISGEGHADGTGAVAIPVGQFLAFDHKLAREAGVKYRLDMRLKLPTADSKWRSIFMLDTQANAGDAALLIKSDCKTVGSGVYFGWDAPVQLTANAWNTVSILCDGKKATFQVNGQWGADSLDRTYTYEYTDTSNLPMFGLSGDDNGEDNLLYFDDVKLYGEGAAVPVVPPADTGLFYATGEQQLLIANTRTYAVKGSAYGTAAGVYPITVGLLDPEATTWSDGSTADKVVLVSIAEHQNAWVREPAVGVPVWTADEAVPAVDPGKSAYGTTTVLLDGESYDASQSLSAGEHVFTFVVAATAEGAKITKAIPVTVLPAGGEKPRKLTAAAYVTNGITMLLDGKDNVGFGLHDGAATTWKDLSGNGYDWTVNPTYAEWKADGLTITGGTKDAAAGEQVESQSFDYKISAAEFIWKTDVMKDGIIFGPGWSSLDYLYTDADGKVCFFNKLGVPATAGAANAYSVNYGRSADRAHAQSVLSVTVDGVAKTPQTADYFTTGVEVAPLIGNRRLYSLSPSGDLRTLRLYAKTLTDDERALNAAIDCKRYGIGALPASLATDGYRIEGGEVLVRFELTAKRGVASVNGRAAERHQTLWVPIGSTVTVQTAFDGVTPERAAAFVRTGLPADTVCSADGLRFTFIPQGPVAAQVTHPDATAPGLLLIFR